MAKKKSRGNGDGDVFPRKNKDGKIIGYRGTYWVQTADGPKRRYVSGKTKAETRAALNKAKADRDGGLVYGADGLKVENYLRRWLEDSVKDTVRGTTFERYEQNCRKHIIPTLGHVKLKNLTPAHVRGLYKEKLQSLSPRSVRYIHVTLHKALKQAMHDGLIPRNVTEAVKPPQIQREEMRPLTPEQAKTFLETVHAEDDRLGALYVMAVTTGLRQGELLGLKWDDIDLEAGTLQVRRTLTTAKGGPVLSSPKTKGSRRTVKLSQTALRALRRHLDRQLGEDDRAGSLWRENGLIFASEVGEPLDRRYITTHRFKPLIKQAGLPEIRFHDLRHTCATILLSKNVNPKVVSEMLEHASIAITLDTYSHVLPDMQDSAATAMDGTLS
jgi:integrase